MAAVPGSMEAPWHVPFTKYFHTLLARSGYTCVYELLEVREALWTAGTAAELAGLLSVCVEA